VPACHIIREGKRQPSTAFRTISPISDSRSGTVGAKGRGCYVHGKCFVDKAEYRLILIENPQSHKNKGVRAKKGRKKGC